MRESFILLLNEAVTKADTEKAPWRIRVGDKMEEATRWALEPVNEAIIGFFNAVFINIMNSLPMVLVTGGLICFVITMAMGKHKPYFWGLGMWGMSAILRGLNIELGI